MSTSEPYYLAIDLGAESGRAIVGRLVDGAVEMKEVHRFANDPVRLGGTLYWDFPRLFHEIVRSLRLAAEASEGRIASIAVDSWGVDFGLLDANGDFLGLPVHYRDERTRGLIPEVCQRTSREELYSITGTQFLEINTLVQLAAIRKRFPELLYVADKLLLIADLVSYFLCGVIAGERTLCSTTQLLDARSREWSSEIASDQGIPETLLPPLVDPATVLGPLREDIARDAGLADPPQVVACAAHDTACAVAAVPAIEGGSWAFVSSGTWSIVGLELDSPELDRKAHDAGFASELGAFGTVRFLRNVCGLWLIQECRREWEREGKASSYEHMIELAEAAPPSKAWLDLDSPDFLAAGSMPERIREHCRRTGQPEPTTRGDIVRSALESLARSYLQTLRTAEEVASRRIERLHIVGGGSRIRFLDQLTANLLRIPVVAGPIEATALGNILLQAHAAGEVRSLADLRAIAAKSPEIRTYRPRER
ncbi:MAG TPA: rhamnulokinase family protein [Planctomycetota bacterium]|nr:rhamnulokinase family protein [Planctomycetota bacterium]